MSWLSAVPDVLACAGLFFVPGLLATYLGGLRGITAWATAPLVTVGVVAVVAVLGGLFNFRFGIWPVVAGTVVVACLAAALARLLRARGVGRPPRDPGRYSLAVVIGAVAAAVIGTVTFITGITRPDAISQTWDAIFHYNAIRYIEQAGKASPLTIATLGQPGAKAGFYPDAWHGMAALLAELTGAPIPVTAMVMSLVIAALVWPLSCLLLARHLFGGVGGRAIAAVVVTGMLSSLFGGFPWLMTGWGVLWPNALGMALAPVGVALGMSVFRISDGDTFGAQRWFFGLMGAWAIGIAHPNSALSVAIICVFPLAMAVRPYVQDQWNRHNLRTTLVLLALVAVATIGAFVFFRLPAVRAVEGQFWPPFQSPGQAAVSALSNSTDGQAAEWLLTAFLIIGAIACFIRRQRRWLVCAEVVIAALYVGSAADGSHLARMFTGLWYDDSHRFAATLPVVAIPLTTIGVLAVGDWLQQALRRVRSATAVITRPAVVLALPVAVGVVVAAATAAQSVSRNAYTLGYGYSTAGDEALVSPAKLQFLQTVARLVPHTALVADNPTGGTAFLFALSGTRVLYPQMDPASNNENMTYLAHNLTRLGQNPRVCDLVRRYDVGYLVVAPENYINSWPQGFYSGVTKPPADSGFRLIASAAGGQLRLYKITMCQPSQAEPVEAATRNSG